MSKLLAVIGATGNQGGAVIESILNDPEAKSQFKMRGLTRDANSSKSKALAAKGIEMVSVSWVCLLFPLVKRPKRTSSDCQATLEER